MLYVYVWRNNPKRQTLYGRRCRVIATFPRWGSVVVEFCDNGQRECVSRRALRQEGGEKVTSFAQVKGEFF